MWFMNKIVNPMVSLILRSPLHGLMSASVMLITYKGRKSGREYSLPVQYVQDDQTIYIIVGMHDEKTWWRNLRLGAKVKLWLRGKIVTGEAAVLEGEAEIDGITRALNLYLQGFPAVASKRGIHVADDGSFNQDDVRREASTTVIVRVELSQ